MQTTMPERGGAPRGEFFGWQASAACRDLPPQTVFARREKDALPALRACRRCPVRRPCEAAVDPTRSLFDGVSAGRLWRNGRPVRLRLLLDATAPAARTAPGVRA
ncbi:WhiB family transcriptional regulator [Streptomyces sp. TRM70308]|uniref:WhiB family transcriptional regulator n=1 Tax=Streptomyces sp. TRM70308 TaxID=3131932 RepID=UPI003D02DC76